MTAWHYRWLCQFAYIDLPKDMIKSGLTLGVIAKEILERDVRGELECGRLEERDRDALNIIRREQKTAQMQLIDFVNRNSSTGFAAYALRVPEEGVCCVFRGSEGRGCGVPNAIDWIDNFLAPFYGSVQYDDIRRLAARFEKEKIVFSGHSKGAHNALYALAVCRAKDARAVVFNGQGFAPGQLKAEEKRKLAHGGVNYVTRGDLVGVLLQHPERRIFVRCCEGENPHALSSVCFDRRGDVKGAMRPLWSLLFEWGSSQSARFLNAVK